MRKTKTFAVLAGLLVGGFSLFAAHWVNGNTPLPAAVSTSLILGAATLLATSKGDAKKSR